MGGRGAKGEQKFFFSSFLSFPKVSIIERLIGLVGFKKVSMMGRKGGGGDVCGVKMGEQNSQNKRGPFWGIIILIQYKFTSERRKKKEKKKIDIIINYLLNHIYIYIFPPPSLSLRNPKSKNLGEKDLIFFIN